MKRLKDRFIEQKYYLIILLLFWITVIIISNPFEVKFDQLQEQLTEEDSATPLGEINAYTELIQTITCPYDNINGISLLAATFSRENSSKVIIEVFEKKSNKCIYSETLSGDKIKDNEYFDLDFETQIGSQGKQYEIKITGVDGKSGNAFTVYTTPNSSQYTPNLLEYDKNIYAGVLICKIQYSNVSNSFIKLMFWVLIIVVSIIFTLLISESPQKNFLVVSLILGSFIIIYNPFTHPLDESTHFLRSNGISQGDFHDAKNKDGQIGFYVAENYEEILGRTLSLKTYFSDPSTWNQKFSSNKVFYNNAYMSSVIPVNHSVTALGLFIGKTLGMSVLLCILLGRICNYIAYIVLCYFAIKNMKYYKNLFFIVATLPLGLWVAASFSIDSILIGSGLLFTSICLKYRFDSTIKIMTKKDMIILLLCATSILSVKYLIYSPILLLFFYIPRKVLNKKIYFSLIGSAGLVTMIMLIWQVYLLKQFPFTEDRNGHVDLVEQLQYMQNHLGLTLKTFTNFFVNAIISHFESFNFQVAITSYARFIGLFALVAAVLERKKFQFETKKMRRNNLVILLIISIIIYALIMLSLYLGFTPVGSTSIDGVHTRYLLPFLPLVLIAVSNINVTNHISKFEEKTGFIMGLGIINTLCGIMVAMYK